MPTATESRVKPVVTLEPVDRVYKFDGTKIKDALAKVGVPQSRLAELCGFSGSAHVCRLLNNPNATVHGDSLKPIVKALRQVGVKVDGFDDEE